jgi:hypothetical protein
MAEKQQQHVQSVTAKLKRLVIGEMLQPWIAMAAAVVRWHDQAALQRQPLACMLLLAYASSRGHLVVLVWLGA